MNILLIISFDNLNCSHRDKIRVNEDNQEIHKDVIIAVSSDPDLKVDVSICQHELLILI